MVVAEYAATASGENKMVKVIIRIAECYITCLEKVCDYINKSAYCYMAVSGDGFCKSAWNGFLLNMKHAMKFAFANFLAQGFILLGKLGIVVINLVFLLAFINSNTFMKIQISIITSMTLYPSNKDSRGI